jgi:hypothetical protein
MNHMFKVFTDWLRYRTQPMKPGGTISLIQNLATGVLNITVTGGVLLVIIIWGTGCGQPSVVSDLTTESVSQRPALATATTQTENTQIPAATPSVTSPPSAARTPTSSATAPLAPIPTITPTPSPIPTVKTITSSTPISPGSVSGNDAGVQIYTTTLKLPTYPFADYLIEEIDPVYNMPVYYFNRPAFEADAPETVLVEYSGVVLENNYLRLTFLPQLGGRLYSAVVKSTGQEIFYHNPVVKPSQYGILQPYEANWWLATGGIEWAYPTQEHGYRFGVPWTYTTTQTDEAAIIQLSDMAANRPGLTVKVTLPADSASFLVEPELINNGPETVPFQLWTNAALTLAKESMAQDTKFIVPSEVITVHSRGEAGWTVPGERTQTSWPQIPGTDLSDYQQWANYLGFFISNTDAPFIGAYSATTRLGIVRTVDPNLYSGAGKIFAFGNSFSDRSYTDDESQYFEIWGGINAGFWPDYDLMIAPKQSVGWQEQWWPMAGLPTLTWASDSVALAVTNEETNLQVSMVVVKPTRGEITIKTGRELLLTELFTATPAEPLQWTVAANSPITIEIIDTSSQVLLSYTTSLNNDE